MQLLNFPRLILSVLVLIGGLIILEQVLKWPPVSLDLRGADAFVYERPGTARFKDSLRTPDASNYKMSAIVDVLNVEIHIHPWCTVLHSTLSHIA